MAPMSGAHDHLHINAGSKASAADLEFLADAIACHAGDCARWGFGAEAAEARDLARSLRVEAILKRSGLIRRAG